MNLNLATPVSTPNLAAMLGSVGAGNLLSGTVYTPIMQTLIAPVQQGENSVAIWELSQKIYAAKDSSVDLDVDEVKLIRGKLDGIAFPWLRARLLDVLVSKPVAVAQEGT